MRTARTFVHVLTPFFILLAFAAAAVAAGPGNGLLGKWKMTTPARDAAGSVCPFVPEMMEFFSDGTMTMSNMPGNRAPFKTDLTPEERQAIETRDPALKGKNLLLVKPVPQMEWRSTPMVYGYSVARNTLTLSVTGWSPATFKRMK